MKMPKLLKRLIGGGDAAADAQGVEAKGGNATTGGVVREAVSPTALPSRQGGVERRPGEGADFIDDRSPQHAGRQPDGAPERSTFFRRPEADLPFHQHDFRTRVEFFKGPKPPKILISDAAYRRMWLIVDLAPKEVGWIGTAERLPSGNFYIDEIFVPEQMVTGAETDPTDEGQFNVMNELAEQGEEGMQKIEKLRFWGHSHVRMGTTASYTDENTPFNYQRLGLPWFIRGIFNKHGRAEFTVYLFEEGYRFLDVPWEAVDAQTGEKLTSERARTSQRSPRSIEAERDPGVNAESADPTVERGIPSTRPAESSGFGLWAPPSVNLHPKLVASASERKRTEQELKAKLRERYFGSMFGGWGRDERPGAESGAPGQGLRDERQGLPERHRQLGGDGLSAHRQPPVLGGDTADGSVTVRPDYSVPPRREGE